MPEFTRDDEYSLDLLRAKKEAGKIQAEEVKMLQQLEQKYDTFINEGLSNLSRMASRRSTRQLRLRDVLISWPMLLLILCCFFTALFLLQFHDDGREWLLFILQWHLRLVGVLLAWATVVGFTQIRERRVATGALLASCVLVPVLLGLVTLAICFRGRAEAFDRWDEGLFSVCWVGDGLIAGESAALLFLR
ncbi:uncharacterized protein Tco025E_05604 [Trypanosoma conorhini]|uniref:Transmembrane protein n=1 Tax=Trypanosoma conorhini TaxID=83891 RepID=A0A422PBP6_9TRYP|nr:uncharacterized protein Tco025E_05604 [Trypanosoma conorhini]RNF15134.1 hypothetical protein Tco025E_05604 [Trypanosoma conorhini]